MFAVWLTFNPCSKATNIGYLLSLGADFGCWGNIEFHVGSFGNSSTGYGFLVDKILKIDTQVIVIIVRQFYNNKPNTKRLTPESMTGLKLVAAIKFFAGLLRKNKRERNYYKLEFCDFALWNADCNLASSFSMP